MSYESQVKELEQSIKRSRDTLDLHDALVRLQSNRDFKKVILEEYFKAEAVRLVEAFGDPDLQSEADQAWIANGMRAIGALKEFLANIEFAGECAAKDLEHDVETLDEISME